MFYVKTDFLCKNCNPLKKGHPLTPSKNWGPVKAPLFENLVGGSAPLQAERGDGHYAIVSPLILSPLTRFSPGLFVVLQEKLYQSFFALIRLLQKILHFQSKTNFFFQLFAGRFWFYCFVYMCFLGHFLTVCHHGTTNSFIFEYIHSFLFDLSLNHMA